MTHTLEYDETPEEDINLGVAPEHVQVSSIKTQFERWHHPRKQWVRVQQWCSASRRLIKELNLPEGEPFRYLTLPGNELLDIRALSGVCKGEQVKIRFLGFNSVGANTPAQAELDLSQNEVRGLDSVDNLSRVIAKRLESVANKNSQEYRATQDLGPFHAINIDLCDSIAFRDINSPKGSILDVLSKIVEIQLSTNKPWLLFVTTLAQPDLLSDRNRSGFTDAIMANVRESQDFKAALSDLISIKDCNINDRILEAWTNSGSEFIKIFSTGFGKWMLRILDITQPKRSLTLLDSCYYRVGEQSPNMLSLVFRCDTAAQGLIDRDGILEKKEEIGKDTSYSEVQLAINLTRKLHESKDLDKMLAQDSNLAAKLIKQAGRLMSDARFDNSAYEIWAKDELDKFTRSAALTG